MSWVTVIWSMVISSCLTLAAVHGAVWFQRRTKDHALFTLTAVATALLAVVEMWMMRAGNPDAFAAAVRWLHVPALGLVLTLVVFMRTCFHAGRAWLGWAACGLRALSLVFNFTTGVNLNYQEITGLVSIPFLGEFVATAVGPANPLMACGQLSLFLLVVFLADASIEIFRRGDRRQSIIVVFIALCVFMTMAQAILVFWGVIAMPITGSIFYMSVVVAMGFEISRDVLRAASLSDELRESEQRMTLAAEAASLGFWVRDLDSRSVWATEKWRELFGFDRSVEVSLDDILKRVHPDDRETMRRILTTAVVAEGSYDQEHRLQLPDGTVRWISSRGSVEFNGGGKPHLVRGVSIDVTSRKRAEAEALQHRNEVTHLSRVTMLGELSGSLAHELNQPLTAILSNAQAAQRFLARPEIDRAELGEILSDIVESDRHAGEIIRSLRFLLKKSEVSHQPLDLNEIIHEVLKLMRSDLLNHHISVELDLTNDLQPVHGDPVQLQQVLLNLILNASDAMAENVPSERRLLLATTRNGDGLPCVFVRDTGPGIPADELERIFEPYHTTKAEGLGLGLAVCRSILDAHHGKLVAENHPDGGAVFHFTLPLGTAASLTLAPNAP